MTDHTPQTIVTMTGYNLADDTIELEINEHGRLRTETRPASDVATLNERLAAGEELTPVEYCIVGIFSDDHEEDEDMFEVVPVEFPPSDDPTERIGKTCAYLYIEDEE